MHFRLLLLLALFPAFSRAVELVQESGSLRAFIGGQEPGCAYDNFISHTSEHIDPNDYGPPELDQQLNGFGASRACTSCESSLMAAALLLLREGASEQALDSLNAVGQDFSEQWQLVHFLDTELDRQYWLLREMLDSTYVDPGFWEDPEDDVIGSFHFGWGLYVVNQDPARENILIEAPHPCDDFISPWLAGEYFLRADAALLFINGAGRALPNADPTRTSSHPANDIVHAFRMRLREQGEYDLTLQFHSYDYARHPGASDIVLSCHHSQQDVVMPPLFDQSYSGLGVLSRLANPLMPAEEIWWLDEAVYLYPYVCINSAIPLRVPGDGYGETLMQPWELTGFSGNISMRRALQDIPNCGEAEHFLHLEFSEQPTVADSLTPAEFFSADTAMIPNWSTFDDILAYYRPLMDSLTVVYDYMLAEDCARSIQRPVWVKHWTPPTEVLVGWPRIGSALPLEVHALTGAGGWGDPPGTTRTVVSDGCITAEYLNDSVWLQGESEEMLTLYLECVDAHCDTIPLSDTLYVPLPYSASSRFLLGLRGTQNRMLIADTDSVIQVRFYNSDHMLDMESLELRVDLNRNGEYDADLEEWQSLGYTGDASWKLIEIPVALIPDNARFELHIGDTENQTEAYSGGLGQAGIQDDWYICRDTIAPAPPAPLLITQSAASIVQLSWSVSHDHWPADFVSLLVEVRDATSGISLLELSAEELPPLADRNARQVSLCSESLRGRRIRVSACAVDGAGNRSLACCSNTLQMSPDLRSQPQLVCAFVAPDELRLQWGASGMAAANRYRLYYQQELSTSTVNAQLLLETTDTATRLKLADLPAKHGCFFVTAMEEKAVD